MLLFSAGKSAMKAPRYCQLHDDACTLYSADCEMRPSANTPRFFYPYGAMMFIAAIPLGFQIANKKQGGAHRMGDGRIDYSENFRASLFHDDLSNEPSFRQIHLAGQYL